MTLFRQVSANRALFSFILKRPEISKTHKKLPCFITSYKSFDTSRFSAVAISQFASTAKGNTLAILQIFNTNGKNI